jgi:photosystem II stability/assembly factor-like uncharacterized protein
MSSSCWWPRIIFVGLALLAIALSGGSSRAQWTAQLVAPELRFRGLCVVDTRVVWASGTGGTVLRTTDGGRRWQVASIPGATDRDLRDIHAVDDRTACALSIGEGEKSRIDRTTDGGKTWTSAYINRDPKGFLDAIAFWDADRGLSLGDPVDGRFVIVTTDDGGRTWKPISPKGMPPALSGEGAFAASGTCLVVAGDGRAWFGTGGARASRVFRSDDRGRIWTAHETPIRAGTPSAGIFSLAFHDADHGIAIGGDYREPGQATRIVALTSDGGRTWRRPAGPEPGGYRSAVAIVPGTQGRRLIAVGPTGTDASTDGGETWRHLGAAAFHAVGFAVPDAGWAAGDGLIARFEGQFGASRPALADPPQRFGPTH